MAHFVFVTGVYYVLYAVNVGTYVYSDTNT